jgi:metal-dependent amidase/aminoacylase/carboxypeptidase family protein
VKLLIEKRFKEMLSGICEAHGCTFELDYRHDYPATVNHSGMAEFARKFIDGGAVPELKLRESEMIMGSEDFSCYQQEIPGLYVFVGAKPDGEFYPHHHPKFHIDESCLLNCAKFFAGFTVDFLESY